MRARIASTSRPAAKAIARNMRSTCLPPAVLGSGLLAPMSGDGASVVIGPTLGGDLELRELRDCLLLQLGRQLGVVRALGESLTVVEHEREEALQRRALVLVGLL